jgi:hypothetical protein
MYVSGWWFGTCFIFHHNIWDNPSHWLSYFSRWLLHHQPGLTFDPYPGITGVELVELVELRKTGTAFSRWVKELVYDGLCLGLQLFFGFFGICYVYNIPVYIYIHN